MNRTKPSGPRILPAGCMAAGEPDVQQGRVCGYKLTFNPDDRRFYVHSKHDEHDVLATFGTYRRAVRFAMTRGGAA